MKRWKHNRGNYHLTSGHMGQLMPIGLWELLPNETVRHRTNAVIRLSPMAAPVMHPIEVRVHHFFVSMRQAWGDQCGKAAENFLTGGPTNADETTIPQMQPNGRTKGDLLDYLGVPPVDGVSHSALPVRAVNQIWNEFYRDQDLQQERQSDDTTLPYVAWEKDNFTAARPWPQKGPEITLPIANVAPVKGLGKITQTFSLTNQAVYETGASGTTTYAKAGRTDQDASAIEEDPNNPGYPGVYADLSLASGVPVTELRRALALQRMAEQRSRYGSRYTEFLRYSFGSTPADARLQRPEYLGGGRTSMSIREVLQTGPEATPGRFGVGDLYGHGMGAVRSNSYVYHAQEHGFILSFLSVRPKAMYVNGIDRLWLKQDREDFFQRELQYIGQQAVRKGEVYVTSNDQDNQDTFGWSDRYSEYRRSRSRVSGEFRNDLDYWHMGRKFSGPAAPALNAEFIKCDPTKRIFNVQNRDTLWVMVQHQMASRSVVDRSAYGKII